MPRPIRILHIIRNLGLGGAETNLLNLAGSFDPARVETHVAYSYGGEFEARFRATGLRLFKYASGDHRVKSLHTPWIVLRLARYVRRHGIDIVHTHNFSGHVWGLLAAKITGAKLVEHVHDFRYTPLAELERRHGVIDQYRFTPWFRRRSDRVIVLTDAHRDDVVGQGYAASAQVRQIPNGIARTDPSRDDGAVRARLGLAPDRRVILTVARMDASKNIELILRIAPAVLRHEPRSLFVVAGSGSELAAYRDTCRRQSLDDAVRFIGFEQDVGALLAVADVFLLPSFLELHSIAILEAMNARVPVVVSRGVGCNDAFIEHGINGFLCDPFDDAEWIESLRMLSDDAALRAAVGEAGRETCGRLFDIRLTAIRLQQLYSDLVA